MISFVKTTFVFTFIDGDRQGNEDCKRRTFKTIIHHRLYESQVVKLDFALFDYET